MVVSKVELENKLNAEKEQILEGRLKDENPLDDSKSFRALCEACRLGDIKRCMEMINEGVNINGRDEFDYTPLILASLCGHYEVVQLLLESGALCQRDTFQGERCLYNALNDRIRNLLLGYDYSKTTHPLQPFASHINSLLSREHPETWDVTLTAPNKSFRLHKFILAARSPSFKRKLALAPGIKSLRLPGQHVVSQALEIAVRFIYLGEAPVDIGLGGGSGTSDHALPAAIEKLSRHLEMEGLWEGIMEGGDRRIARQRRADEIVKCRDQVEHWYRENVLKHKITVETSKANNVRWDRDNTIFADVLLRADEDIEYDHEGECQEAKLVSRSHSPSPTSNGIPIGPVSRPSRSPSRTRRTQKSVLFPAHRAMLIRSEFFLAMFSSSFKEAQYTEHLQIIPIDCSPEVLQIILDFLYTEQAEIPLDLAIDVLLAADLLLLERLKTKAAVVISTLGNGSKSSTGQTPNDEGRDYEDADVINIYDVVRAGWLTRMQRLDEFGARYLASRLEDYIDEDEFADLIRESAARIKQRQETDSIELLDDIRFYLSERFRLRFEDAGLEDMLDEEESAKDNVTQDCTQNSVSVEATSKGDPANDTSHNISKGSAPLNLPVNGDDLVGRVRTLEGDIAGDEFDADAINYRILLGKIDNLLERLKLDA